MITRLMKYSGAVSKVKAMKARLMVAEDYEAMASMTELSSVFRFLCERCEYADVFGSGEAAPARGELESLLNISMYRDLASLYRFVTGAEREFLENYFCKIEIALLKNAAKGIMDNEKRKMDLSMFEDFFNRHTCLNVSEITAAQTLEEFLSALSQTPYHGVLAPAINKGAALFDIELSLDLYYFRRMWRVNSVKTQKHQRELVEKVMGTEIDIMNLIWIFRVKRFYDVPDEIIFSYIIPIHYKLSRDETKRLICAKGIPAFLDEVEKTRYKGFFDDVKDSGTGIIRKYWKTVYSINQKSERQDAFSLAPILAYMDYKDIEIRNIITVIEAIHYEMAPKEIMSRLIIPDSKGGTENGDS